MSYLNKKLKSIGKMSAKESKELAALKETFETLNLFL